MNALAEMPVVVRSSVAAAAVPPPLSRGSYFAGLCAALGIHAAILFAWPRPEPQLEPVEFGVEMADASVEVSLVAAPPAEEPAAVVETPPDPAPPQPEPELLPVVEPPPVLPALPPAMTLPEPEPPRPIQLEPPKPKPRKPQARPKPPVRPARAAGDGSSATLGNDATSAVASAGAASAKASYLRNPHPAYPEAARAARQQGVVTLAVKVDAQGGVIAVRVARSSGCPLLDERAHSTVSERWKFRPATTGGVPIPSEVTIPIRFTLDR